MMRLRYYLLVVALGCGVFLFVYRPHLTAPTELFFSNTQVWDTDIEPLQWRKQQLLPDITEIISLPVPPTNSSTTTQSELAQLHKLEAARTPEQVNEIEAELLASTTPMAGELMADLMYNNTRPQTGLLLSTTFRDFDGLIIYYKAHFDRIRPSLLDPMLTPAIAVPGHPAYPSGHAAQATLAALILGDLDPGRAEAYRVSAKQISHNREIAGVHYPSDSAAGALLAEQYFHALRQLPWYQAQMDRARREWPGEE